MMKRGSLAFAIMFVLSILILIFSVSCGTLRELDRERDKIVRAMPVEEDKRLAYINSWYRDNPGGELRDEFLFQDAEIRLRRQEYELAENRYREMLTKYPRSLRHFAAIYGLAIALENQGRRKEALQQCENFMMGVLKLKRRIERKNKDYRKNKKKYRLQLEQSRKPSLNVPFRRFYADILMKEGGFADALFQYRIVLRLLENESLMTHFDLQDLRFNAAICSFGLQDVNQARELLLLNIEQAKQYQEQETIPIQDYILLGSLFRGTGQALEAVELYLDALQQQLREADRLFIVDAISETINSDFTEQQLLVLLERYRDTFPGPTAIDRLIDILENQQRYQEAIDIIKPFSKETTNQELANKLLDRTMQLEWKLTVNPYAIGFIAPLSGKFAPLGQEIARGARLAIMEQNKKTSLPAQRFVLYEMNTAGNPESIHGLIDTMVRDYQVIGIIGPVTSKSIEYSLPHLEYYDIAAITPATSEQNISRKSSGLFRNSLTNEQQIAVLCDYLVRERGYRNFCLLSPQMLISLQLRDLFRTTVRQLGGRIKADIVYPTDTNDFSSYLKPLQHTSIDVFFIPDYPARVGEIAPQLRFFDFSSSIIAGVNMLNSPDLIKIGGKYIEHIIFPDDFVLESQTPELQDFIQQYTDAFGVAPTRYAAQAYDAVRIMISAVTKGINNRASLKDYISELSNFSSVIGALSMNDQGDLVRTVNIMTVRGGMIVPAD